jgi:hypothetical protein
MLVAGIILSLVAIALFVISRVMAGKAVSIAGTEKTTASAIRAEAKGVADEIGGGSFSKYAELSGTIKCATPLDAELSGTKCVHYETKVVREYEETYVERNNDGSSQTRTRRGTENVSLNSRSCVFSLDDGSGELEVDPAGAEFHLDTTMSKFQPGEDGFSIGTFVLNNIIAGTGGRRTIGYRLEEKSLPVERLGYVFGEVGDTGGALRIGKSGEHNRRLIISIKSEKELIRSAKTGALWLTISSCAALAAGIAMFVLIIMKKA